MKKLRPEAIIATFFGIGKFPFASGTMGSIAGILLVAFIFYQPHFVTLEGKEYLNMGGGFLNPDYIIYVLVILTLLLHVIGVWASEKYSKLIGAEDPKAVVIDEVAGIFTASTLIACIYAGLVMYNSKEYILYLMLSYWFFPVVFVLFRLFDILKPWHIGHADKNIKGGLGIMLDDQIAGIYTAISFYIIFFALKFSDVLDSMITVQ